METIHISEIYNREKIQQNGLIPSKVALDHHLESFWDYNYLSRDEDKMLYMWLDSEKNEKFIKDMMYCKMWLSPRNKYGKENCELFDSWKDVDMKNIYPYTEMIYDVYKINNPQNVVGADLYHLHIQTPSDNELNTTYNMDVNYAHEDKPLMLSKVVEKDIAIIGQCSIRLNKDGKIKTQIYKTVRY